ncbi:hypothetical protein [Pseudonocardia oroxyli]|uniref:HIRAN domain-containing protein n=1 Tax=Pseudonocardia oroxyli TaxID=366584 RepID=A0A1G7RMY9_PSEOR|nr:hypothetical protein [Pseudonocardia oroxyli]SDG12063.1 hypothetical protein SAMN05216377_10978 [Pseudonocardia oroxyli]
MSLETLADVPERSALPSARRLVVAWQHPETRLISAIGMLECEPEGRFRFRYLRRAAGVQDFRPFLGFPRLDQTYEAERLFPLFATRVMSPRRPDFRAYLDQLHLSPDATPWEQMARSEGRRTGDTIQVLPVPDVGPDLRSDTLLLVHGIRHVVTGAMPVLVRGDELGVVPDRTNRFNPAAQSVTTAGGQPLGYVPDMLLEHLGAMQSAGPVRLAVEHVNGPEAPPHLRVLARLTGTVPPGYRPMAGPGWETFDE